jgi:osmotically-inducible protein OsmY
MSNRPSNQLKPFGAFRTNRSFRNEDRRTTSDADIARSVENAMLAAVRLPNDSIKVMVEKGWVTLSGVVKWHYQKRAAAETMRYLAGVTR